MAIADKLSELTLRTKETDIPTSSYSACRKMLLDTLGCAICGYDADGVKALIDLECKLSAKGPSSVLAGGTKLTMPSAAFCNSLTIHALDFDNNYPGADLHIMSIVVPVALACAEETGCNVTEFLAGIIMGVEIAGRIAKPYMRASRPHSYFLTTSLVGGWGGVATAARILGLSENQTTNAFGIYYAHTCGNRQALLAHALTKRMQPAIATRAALYSALSAAQEITGPQNTFEGQAGFYRLYTQDVPPEECHFAESSGKYCIEELSVKKYPTCGIHHGNIAAALYLKEEHHFDASQIEKVEFYLREGGGTLVSHPFILGDNPQVNAQFSAPYAIALALSRGRVNIDQFSHEAIVADNQTLELAAITFEIKQFGNMKSIIDEKPEHEMRYTKVYLNDGTVLEHKCGDAAQHNPDGVSLNFVKNKFRCCARMQQQFSVEKIEQMISLITKFSDLDNIPYLISRLVIKG